MSKEKERLNCGILEKHCFQRARIHIKIQVVDEPDAPSLHVTNGQLEFRDVSFQYSPTGKSIIKNLSFVLPAGQTYALVGHSGGGKSTVSKLLFRFYDIQSGKIFIDGQDISKVTQKSLRESIGIVPQDTALFNADVRYNINYGNRSASDGQVEAAAAAADIHDKINALPEKYDSMIGERGLKLSGGERQRIAIARAIISFPKIIVFDEATSSLDSRTERNIQTSLAGICENRSTLIIAHRLSAIVHAHQILVLQDGQIVERGTHEELLNEAGVYAEMWHMQKASAEDGLTSPASNHQLSPSKSISRGKCIQEQEEDLSVVEIRANGLPEDVPSSSGQDPGGLAGDTLSDDQTDSESVTCTHCGVRLPSLSRNQSRCESPVTSPHQSDFSITSATTSPTMSSGSQHICSQCASLVQSPIQETLPVLEPDSNDDASNPSFSVWKLNKKHSAASEGDMEQFLSMSMAYGIGHDVRMCETSNNR